MFRFLLKKLAWNWCSRRPLLNKPAVQGLIQPLVIRKLQQLSLQSFTCLNVVGEFQDLVLVLPYIGDLLLADAKFKSYGTFVLFSPLSKSEIIIGLSFIERTHRFRFVDMLSFELWPLRAFTKSHAHRTDQAWHSLSNKTILNQSKFSWMHQNALRHGALNLLKEKR